MAAQRGALRHGVERGADAVGDLAGHDVGDPFEIATVHRHQPEAAAELAALRHIRMGEEIAEHRRHASKRRREPRHRAKFPRAPRDVVFEKPTRRRLP